MTAGDTLKKKWISVIPVLGVVSAVVLLVLNFTCSGKASSSASASDSTRTLKELMESPESGVGSEKRVGKAIYTRYCEVCHGREGDGKGFNAFNLQSSFGVQPADFTDSAAAASRPLERAILVISKGGTAAGKSPYMPPWEWTLSVEEIEDAATYVRTFSNSKEGKD